MAGFTLPITWQPCRARPDVMHTAMLGSVEGGRVHVSGRSCSWLSRLTPHQTPVWTSARSEGIAREAVENAALRWVLAAGLRPAFDEAVL